ncbi:MAG: Tubulin gamma-2 chain [Marteilia pararefringens]
MGSKKFSINDTLRRLLKPQNTMASISSSYFTPLTNSSEIVCRKVEDLPGICPSPASNDGQDSAKMPSNSRLKHKFISLMSILRGEVDYSQINRSMAYLRDQKLVNLVTWTPACFQTCVTHRACKSYDPTSIYVLLPPFNFPLLFNIQIRLFILI